MWLWLGVAVLAVLACCGAGAAVLRPRSHGWQPEKTAGQYFGLLADGDVDGAYAMLCLDTFAKLERDDYADFVYEHGRFDGVSVTVGDEVSGIDGDRAPVHVVLTEHGRHVDSFVVDVEEDDGRSAVCDGVTGRSAWTGKF